eukprot:Rhum_TRINITY_DN847_c0_g1::Rhum_TRINITY_DN847_c0_g1_i1::g.2391::m.2391
MRKLGKGDVVFLIRDVAQVTVAQVEEEGTILMPVRIFARSKKDDEGSEKRIEKYAYRRTKIVLTMPVFCILPQSIAGVTPNEEGFLLGVDLIKKVHKMARRCFTGTENASLDSESSSDTDDDSSSSDDSTSSGSGSDSDSDSSSSVASAASSNIVATVPVSAERNATPPTSGSAQSPNSMSPHNATPPPGSTPPPNGGAPPPSSSAPPLRGTPPPRGTPPAKRQRQEY